jgi:hypothetical protein
MTLPRLAPVDNLAINLPPTKENQVWALNLDTSPESLVLIEFVYGGVVVSDSAQSSISSLNNSLNQSLLALSSQLNDISSRLTLVENAVN